MSRARRAWRGPVAAAGLTLAGLAAGCCMFGCAAEIEGTAFFNSAKTAPVYPSVTKSVRRTTTNGGPPAATTEDGCESCVGGACPAAPPR